MSFSENVQLHRKNVLFVMLINIETFLCQSPPRLKKACVNPWDPPKHSGLFHKIEDFLQRGLVLNNLYGLIVMA